MRTVEHEIYTAFNATSELRARSFMSMTTNDNQLTQEELIVQGSMIRHRLKQELSSIDYLILKLYFTETDDIAAVLIQLAPLRQLIRRQSKIFGNVHYRFFDLSCVSELWGINLFRHPRFSPMQRYLLDGQSPNLLTRRRKRIIKTLTHLKSDALEQAARSLLAMDMQS